MYIKNIYKYTVLMKFLEKHERRPQIKSHDEDATLLTKLREDTLKPIDADCKIVPSDFARFVSFQLVADVCDLILHSEVNICSF